MAGAPPATPSTKRLEALFDKIHYRFRQFDVGLDQVAAMGAEPARAAAAPAVPAHRANSRPPFQVALSFAGEQRDYVRQVAENLKAKEIEVFYDEFEAARQRTGSARSLSKQHSRSRTAVAAACARPPCASRRRALRPDRVCHAKSKGTAASSGCAAVRQCTLNRYRVPLPAPAGPALCDRNPYGPRRAEDSATRQRRRARSRFSMRRYGTPTIHFRDRNRPALPAHVAELH